MDSLVIQMFEEVIAPATEHILHASSLTRDLNSSTDSPEQSAELMLRGLQAFALRSPMFTINCLELMPHPKDPASRIALIQGLLRIAAAYETLDLERDELCGLNPTVNLAREALWAKLSLLKEVS